MRVAMIQLRIDDAEPPPARLDRVLALITSLRGSADLIVLPELWLTGAFATRAAIENAEPMDGPAFTSLANAARNSNVHLLAGSLAETGPSGPYNTAVVFGPDGDRLAVYRKMHLFGFDSGEAARFTAGPADPVLWQSPWGAIGLATCYDVRFPELFRRLTDAGAIGFLVPTGWPMSRIAIWDTLARSRAIENQAWFIGVNAAGTHAGTLMGGASIVVRPTGAVAHHCGTDEEVAVVDIDTTASAAWRTEFPALQDRRLGP
jgi:predicted amidohydrolase